MNCKANKELFGNFQSPHVCCCCVNSTCDILPRWFWRQRIQLTMFGNHANDMPVDLHNQQMLYPEHRFWEHVRESEQMLSSRRFDDIPDNMPPRILPGLALNEVFIGEKLSSRYAHYFHCSSPSSSQHPFAMINH